MINSLTDNGLRDGLTAMADIRKSIKSELATAEQQLGLSEARVNHLRKIMGILDMFSEEYRAELSRRELRLK